MKMINRLIEPTQRPDRARRRRRHPGRPGRAAPPDRLRHPAGRAVPAPAGRRQRRDRAAAARLGRAPARAAGSTSCSTWSGSTRRVYRDRYPAQLSGGQRQRVGVARALAADPPVLLMDEPFSAIDPIARDRLQAEFLRVQAAVRKTIVFVTHDIDEAVRLGDRIAVFRQGGVLEQYDTPAAVLGDPATPFVADFVGADRGLRRLAVTRSTPTTSTSRPSSRPTTRSPRPAVRSRRLRARHRPGRRAARLRLGGPAARRGHGRRPAAAAARRGARRRHAQGRDGRDAAAGRRLGRRPRARQRPLPRRADAGRPCTPRCGAASSWTARRTPGPRR